MNCRIAEHEILRAQDVPLTPDERLNLDVHLSSCPACSRAWEEHRHLSHEAAEWAVRPSLTELPPAEFTARVLARLEARSAPTSCWPRLALAVCLIVLLIALSPFVSGWLPSVPHWRLDWWGAGDLWAEAQGILMARWIVFLLLPSLVLNAVFMFRVRRTV